MTAEDVLTIIQSELAQSPLETNLHGLTEGDILPMPYQEAYISFDGNSTFNYWTVLEEMEDRSGYTIYFDPEQGLFGLGSRTKEGVVDIGTHGTFRDAFRGM